MRLVNASIAFALKKMYKTSFFNMRRRAENYLGDSFERVLFVNAGMATILNKLKLRHLDIYTD